MALSLLPKLFGSGLQVDRGSSSNTRGVYVPPQSTHGEGYYPPPFIGSWKDPIGMGVKKKPKSKGEKSPKARVCCWEKTAHSTQFP